MHQPTIVGDCTPYPVRPFYTLPINSVWPSPAQSPHYAHVSSEIPVQYELTGPHHLLLSQGSPPYYVCRMSASVYVTPTGHHHADLNVPAKIELELV